MKKLNRIAFDKLKLQWRISLYATGVLRGDEAVGEIISNQKQEESITDKYPLPWDNEDKPTVDKMPWEDDPLFELQSKKWSRKEIIKNDIKRLKRLERRAVEKEDFEAAQEAKEMIDALTKEWNKLK